MKIYLKQGVSPVWAIIIVLMLAVIVASCVLVYGYFWQPKQSQGDSVFQKNAKVPNCRNLWWYDNDYNVCSEKQFCGTYEYYGLKTFFSEETCKADLAPFTYKNTDYGFELILPGPWRKYQVGEWCGLIETANMCGPSVWFIKTGVGESIRTSMQIMIFTLVEWDLIKSGNMSIYDIESTSSHDLNPQKIGSNDKYVFAIQDAFYDKYIQNFSTSSEYTKNILTPSINILTPSGGEKWKVGEIHDISWVSEGIDTIIVQEGNNMAGHIVADNISADSGKYSWNIDSKYFASIGTTLTFRGYNNGNCVFSITSKEFCIGYGNIINCK